VHTLQIPLAGAEGSYAGDPASLIAKRQRCSLTSADIGEIDAEEPGGVFEATFIAVATVDSAMLRSKTRAEKVNESGCTPLSLTWTATAIVICRSHYLTATITTTTITTSTATAATAATATTSTITTSTPTYHHHHHHHHVLTQVKMATHAVDRVRKQSSSSLINDTVFIVINVEGIKVMSSLGGDSFAGELVCLALLCL
jgi:hypothetical protein